MVKILVDGLPKEKGGIGTLIMNIAYYNNLTGNGSRYQFEFIVPKESMYIPVLKDNNYKYYEVPRIFSFNYVNTIEAIFKNNKYDFIWINNTSKVNIKLLQIAKRYSTKIIMHVHGVKSEERGLKRIAFKVLECINREEYFNLIDIPFACSDKAARVFYNYRLYKKTIVIPNGIFTNEFKFNQVQRDKYRKILGIKEEEILLGAVGRLTRVKNYTFLIELIKLLPKNYKCIIIGEGEERSNLEVLIDKYSLEKRFLLIGVKENVSSYMNAMDLFIMPSLYEGMPYALIEAQANGLPCLASDTISHEIILTKSIKLLSLDKIIDWIDSIPKNLARNKVALKNIVNFGFDISTGYMSIINAINGEMNNYDSIVKKR